jgi:hypothetical protein
MTMLVDFLASALGPAAPIKDIVTEEETDETLREKLVA